MDILRYPCTLCGRGSYGDVSRVAFAVVTVVLKLIKDYIKMTEKQRISVANRTILIVRKNRTILALRTVGNAHINRRKPIPRNSTGIGDNDHCVFHVNTPAHRPACSLLIHRNLSHRSVPLVFSDPVCSCLKTGTDCSSRNVAVCESWENYCLFLCEFLPAILFSAVTSRERCVIHICFRPQPQDGDGVAHVEAMFHLLYAEPSPILLDVLVRILHHATDEASIPDGNLSGGPFDCRTIPLVGGFSRGSPVSPTFSFRRCSILTSLTFIGSQDLDYVASVHRRRIPRISGLCTPICYIGSFDYVRDLRDTPPVSRITHNAGTGVRVHLYVLFDFDYGSPGSIPDGATAEVFRIWDTQTLTSSWQIFWQLSRFSPLLHSAAPRDLVMRRHCTMGDDPRRLSPPLRQTRPLFRRRAGRGWLTWRASQPLLPPQADDLGGWAR
ncbi:hypothetical protein PR048_028915 [Dryococelus australis]|uniref:Uncharacterized protein n=1 Tax=Dryococelus australis TaxID=614101 RepID=A0ABQ9GEF5_9NEOP|nr:hypothetical protein PR048_028915 [Dryococelus australis]